MTTLGAMVRVAGLGAAAAYFFDPDMGRRRRALVRDQIVHLGRVLREEVQAGIRDAGNRAQGAVATVGRVADPSRGQASRDQGERRRAGGDGLPPAARLAIPVVGAAALGRLGVPRHVPSGAALRLALVGALGAAVTTVERAQQRARAGATQAPID